MARAVIGLISAQPCSRPSFIPRSRPRSGSTKYLGLAFEKALSREFPNASSGPWYQFRDLNGDGWCQPDLVLFGTKSLLVIECKLTWTPEAESQLRDLYVPVLELAHGQKPRALIVCRHLTRLSPQVQVHGDLRSALGSPHKYPILHWLGKSPLI